MNNFQLVSNFDSKYCNSKVRTEKKNESERNERKKQRSFQQNFVTQQYCVYYENFYELSRTHVVKFPAVFAVKFFFNRETFLPTSCLFY